jgi:hypothetical protein
MSTELAERLWRIKDASGLLDPQIARLFGVSIRSLHVMQMGNPSASASTKFADRAAQLEEAVHALPGRTQDERRAALLDTSAGRSLFQSWVAANPTAVVVRRPAITTSGRISE